MTAVLGRDLVGTGGAAGGPARLGGGVGPSAPVVPVAGAIAGVGEGDEDPGDPARSGVVGAAGRRRGRSAPDRWRRVWVVPATVVVVGALALLPSVGGDDPGPGEADVRVEGRAVVARADGTTAVVERASVRLGPGDVVEVTSGSAHFALADGVSFQGRSGPATAGRRGTTVAMGRVPELVAGSLLVVAPVPVAVQAAGSEVAVGPDGPRSGAARLDRRLGLGVGTYAGSVVVDSAGRVAPVAPLRRLEVPVLGAVGRRGLPLAYDAGDPWDRRFLAGALLVDGQLGPLLGAFDASAGTGPATVAGLGRARPGLPAAALEALVSAAPTGSAALVTAVLADLGTGATFADRAEAVRRFRADGAPWGLVTLDRGVGPEALLDGVRSALDRLGPQGVSVGATGGVGGEGRGATRAGVEAEGAGPGPDEPAGAAGPESGDGRPDGPVAPPGGGGPVAPIPEVPAPPDAPPVGPGPGGGPVEAVVDGAGRVVEDVVEGAADVVDGVAEGVDQGLGQVGTLLEGVVDGLLEGLGPGSAPPGPGVPAWARPRP